MSNQESNQTPGSQLFNALTKEEIRAFLDALLDGLPLEVQKTALAKLPADTRQTIQQILGILPESAPDIPATPPVSLAKLAQTWASLWEDWYKITDEAADEDSEYLIHERHWEPPYFDESAFINDLEKVAQKLQPLIATAVENSFSPDDSFAEAIIGAIDNILGGLPEWMEYDGEFYLEKHLTQCLLEWEWLQGRYDEPNVFDFAQTILDWENEAGIVSLEDESFFDFFTQLSEAEQQTILQGFVDNKNVSPWQKPLNNAYSHWHALYMFYVEQFSPEQYLDNLRATISQQWQNGLPVIEDLLAKKAYQESLAVIDETVAAMLSFLRDSKTWTPENWLLFTIVHPHRDDMLKVYRKLFNLYRQTAEKLGQTQLANALTIQAAAFKRFFQWEKMFETFDETAVSPTVRQALFDSWKNYIIERSQPFASSSYYYGRGEEPDPSWWLHWLIESIVDDKKGASWFQQQITDWLARLPGTRSGSGREFGRLRLLTNDIEKINNKGYSKQYPKFFEVVIRSGELPTPDHDSRRAYLKQYAPPDLSSQVMGYWQNNLQNFVPKPESAQKSDYTVHARWMAALRELSPHNYTTLLNHWRETEHRRRNLWKALAAMGLD